MRGEGRLTEGKTSSNLGLYQKKSVGGVAYPHLETYTREKGGSEENDNRVSNFERQSNQPKIIDKAAKSCSVRG